MTRRLLISIAVLVAVAALTVAGCGSDKKDSASTAVSTAQAQKSGGGTPTVSMKDIQFVPRTITAKVGQKITWTNNDSVAHTVTKDKGFKGAGPGSSTVNPGSTYSFTPQKAGTIPYFCQIHPGQTGTIVVTK